MIYLNNFFAKFRCYANPEFNLLLIYFLKNSRCKPDFFVILLWLYENFKCKRTIFPVFCSLFRKNVVYLQSQLRYSQNLNMKRENINIVNGVKRMTDLFGHSENLITLSLSLSLSYNLGSNSPYSLLLSRGRPRKQRLFLQ